LTNESPAKQFLIELVESKASALGIDKGNPIIRDAGNKGRDRLIWALCTCHELLKVQTYLALGKSDIRVGIGSVHSMTAIFAFS
jgi:hypothetical protein